MPHVNVDMAIKPPNAATAFHPYFVLITIFTLDTAPLQSIKTRIIHNNFVVKLQKRLNQYNTWRKFPNSKSQKAKYELTFIFRRLFDLLLVS